MPRAALKRSIGSGGGCGDLCARAAWLAKRPAHQLATTRIKLHLCLPNALCASIETSTGVNERSQGKDRKIL